jgi:zona occludens toxin
MIYLTTGGNGSGKTLFTLYDVRSQQLKENRQVYYHGFEALEPIKDFGWLPFDPKEWMSLPDGAICVMDEAQNEFPRRQTGSRVPQYVADVAQFRRKRGFDFWMITPHPGSLDKEVLNLISPPSFHRHMHRIFGSDTVSQATYSAVCDQPQKIGASKNAETQIRAYPKEVYSWYKSASLHTGKRRIPKKVWVLLASLVLAPALLYYAVSGTYKRMVARGSVDTVSASSGASAPAKGLPLTPEQYVEQRSPRVAGLPHTAPVYDQLTQPTAVPFPSACIKTATVCSCYTQQGTKLDTPKDLCLSIVERGFFLDFEPVKKNVESMAAAPAPG